MRVVILGAGKTGSYVARVLSDESHEVILVDKDAEALEQASRESDVATLQGNSPSWKVFDDLAEQKSDLFFAATGNDETNLLSCSIAKNLGFPKTVARIKEREYLNHPKLDFSRLFCVDNFIGAELLVAQDLYNQIVHAGDIAADHFVHGAVQMRVLRIPDVWDRAGIPISDLSLPDDLIIALIRRKTKEKDQVIIPSGKDHVLPGDEVTIIGVSRSMHRLHEVFLSQKHSVSSVVLIGGSTVAAHLAYFLGQQKIAVRIIEKSETRCHELAELLPNALIIHRDGTDPRLLFSERVQEADALIACTQNDGENLIAASLAKELGNQKPIALVNDSSLIPVFEKSGVIPAFSARVSIANRLLSAMHEEAVLSVRSLGCDAVKMVELKTSPSSSILGIPLSDLKSKLPKDFLIAVIESRGRVMIGKGNRILSPHDTVIAICHPQHISEISPLFH